MPQQAYRANLSAAVFPMTLSKAGRTVIIPQIDQNFDRRVDPAGEQKDAGIPQAIYMENVLPTSNGYQSIGYKDLTDLVIPPGEEVTAIITASIPTANSLFLEATIVFFSDDSAQVSVAPFGGWAPVDTTTYPTVIYPFNNQWSVATVNGTLYAFWDGEFYKIAYDALLGYYIENISATITGFGAPPFLAIRSICSAFNYLVATSQTTVYWSSTTSPIDFVPSLVTGAGSQGIGGNRTYITSLISHPIGFFVYTYANVIAAKYTGNARYPWKFTEISNSSSSYGDKIAASLNNDLQILIAPTGTIQILNTEEANNSFPEVSDYLGRSIIHDVYNQTTNVITQVKETGIVNDQMYRAIWYVLDRYVIISYGGGFANSYNLPLYTHALIYDTLLQRWGKIKRDHTTVVNGGSASFIWFFHAGTGTCTRWILDIYDEDATFTSVLVLGKFQLIRNRLIKLEEIAIESTRAVSLSTDQEFSCVLLPSLDGKNFSTPVIPYEDTAASSEELKVYKVHKTGINHSVVLKGVFDVNTLQLRFTPTADR